MIRHDLLGKTARVVDAKNRSLIGLEGEVVDETQHTLRIKTMSGEKTVLKAQATITVDAHRIQAGVLTGRSHERTKRNITQWHKTTQK